MDESLKVTSADIRNIEEIIDNAKIYSKQLHNQVATLNETYNKVSKCAEETSQDIENAFMTLTKTVLVTIENRKLQLLQQVNKIKVDVLGPLAESKDVIAHKLNVADDVIKAGQNIVNNSAKISESTVSNFYDSSSNIGSLPEIPKPADVPNISAHFNSFDIGQIVATVNRLGKVSYLGPIQIVDSKERPGALAIHWEEVNDSESSLELENCKYQLQCCQGNVHDENEGGELFYEVYLGLDTCCIVRDLIPNCDYTFRVCRSGHEDKIWSLPYVSRTTIEPYRWDPTNANYTLSSGDKIASKCTAESTVLYSVEPQFQSRHCLQFNILECGSSQMDEGIGLSLTNTSSVKDMVRPGVILLNSEGYISIDGIQVTTRLPRLFSGAIITLESEELPNSKMRVTIACEGKEVTYDWRLDQLSNEDSIHLQRTVGVFFFMFFRDIGWKVKVE